MQQLIDLLHEGSYSLVVECKDGKILTYTGRGVSDLYRLYTDSPNLLCGARTADKVVGVGVAVLMVLGGVRQYYVDVISRAALSILDSAGIKGTYAKQVDYIINRAGTGRCPLESRLDGEQDLSIMLDIISRFMTEMQS